MRQNKIKNKLYILGIIFFVILFLFGGFIGTSYFSSIKQSPGFTYNDIQNIKEGNTSKSIFLKLYTNILTKPSLAIDWSLQVGQLFGWILTPIIWVLGKILLLVVWLLVKVSSFNTFIDSTAVVEGWVIVRDICNMFFIAILLLIAFATILHRESYNVKQLLPKLILMAVLINFSRMICGLVIDVAQVAMLTFVNGFKDIAGANMVDMLGISDILHIDTSSSSVTGATKLTMTSIVGSMILALLYLIISIIVVGTMVMVLVYRMVMLWIYIVLSPAAYILAAFPQGKKYSSQWWSEFSKEVVIGPVLAFFIWLSFVSATGSGNFGIKEINGNASASATNADFNAPTAGATVAGTWEHALKFLISIAMLVGGLIVSQQIGGAAGKATGKGMSVLQKGKGMGQKFTLGATKGVAKLGGRTTLKTIGTLANKNGSLGAIGTVAKNWHNDIVTSRKRAREAKWVKRAKSLGMGNKTINSMGDLADSKVGRYTKAGLKISGTAVQAGGMALAGAPFMSAAIGATLFGVGSGAISDVLKNRTKSKRESEKKEVDRAKSDKKTKYQEIEKEKKDKIDVAEKEYRKKKNQIENSVTSPKMQETLISRATAKFNKKKDEINNESLGKKREVDKEYYDKIKHIDNERERKEKINKIESNDNLSKEEKNKKINDINKQHDDYYKYSSSIEHAIDRITNSVTNKDWHPNGAVMAAAKKVKSESKTAENITKTIAGGKSIKDYGGWYSPYGQTSGEKAKFEQLVKNDKMSQMALSRINDNLEKIRAMGTNNLGNKEKNNLRNFFEGLAAFKKGGGDVSGKLDATIEIANDIKVHGDNKDESKTIEELQEQIIEKS